MYNNYLASLVAFSFPMICAKIQSQGILCSREEDFKKCFPYMGMAAILVSGPRPFLAIFRSPNLRRLHIKFEQHWPRDFRVEVVWNFQHFSHTNVWSPYKCIGKQTWPCHKKVKRQCTTIILATLEALSFPMICAKIQPQGILCSGEEDFKVVVFSYMGMAAILVNGPRPF